MISRSHLVTGWRTNFWPIVLIGVLAVKAVISLTLTPTFALSTYGSVVYFLFLLLSTAFAVRNAAHRTLGSRIFWVFIAGGYGLWTLDQWLYLYYGIGLHTDVPNDSVADPALFLHVMPFMAAVATRPHLQETDQKASRASLNFLLFLFFWVFLYGYALFPYQYLFANEKIYNPRFTALYAVENAVLGLALGALAFRTQMPWRRVYIHFFGASALYAISSTLANIAIDSGWQYNGSIYSFAQTAAVCWFVWVPLCARNLRQTKLTPVQPEAGGAGFAALVARTAVVAIPLIGLWELFRINENAGLRVFRLSVVLASGLCLAVAVFVKEYLIRRDLVLDARVIKLQQQLSEAALAQSERKQMQARLREYEKVVESLDDMIAVVDRQYRYVIANRAFLSDRGRGGEEVSVAGRLVSEVVNPGVFEQVIKEKLDECFQGNIVRYELRYRYPQLGERDLLISYFPIEISGAIEEAACVIRDVTERKRADDALGEREEKFHQMADNIQEIFWMVDAATKQAIYVNSAFEQITGRTVASLMDSPLSYREIIHPDDRAHVLSRLDEAERTGVLDEQFRIVRLDGSVRWVGAQGFPIRNAEGKIYRLAGVVQDISERKLGEEALRLSEAEARARAEELAVIFDAIPGMALIAHDSGCRTITGSRKAYELLRLSYGVNISKSAPESEYPSSFRLLNDGVELTTQELPIQKAAATGREVRDSELTVVFDDGTSRDMLGNAVPLLHPGGDVRGAVGVFVDITERKRAEEALRESEDRYRDLVEHSQDLLCTHDLGGRLLSCNPAPARILGYELSELLNIPMRDFIAPEYREQFEQYLARIAKNGADKGLLCVITRSGERRIWEYNNTLRTHGVPSPVVRGMAHDITERKRAEQALRASEREQFEIAKQLQIERARLIEAQAVANVGSWETELPSLKVSWSEQTHRIFGTDPSNFHPTRPDFVKFVHPEDRAKVDAAYKASLKTPAPPPIEYRIVSADGSLKVVEERWKVFHNQQGEPVRLMGTCQDITERKRMETALRRREEDYRRFVAQSSEAIFRQDLDAPLPIHLPEDELIHCILYDSYLAECNDALAKMYGMNFAHDLIGKRLTEMLDLTDPRNMELTREYIRSGFRVLERESHEVDIHGHPKIFLNSMIGIVEDGKLIRTWGIQRDITERKAAERRLGASEERFRQLAESIREVFYLTDAASYRLLYVSPAYEQVWGRSCESLYAAPDSFLEAIHPDDREIARRSFLGRLPFTHQYRIIRPDGTMRWILDRGFPVHDESGRVYRFAGIAEDITERKRAEEGLREAQADLARVTRTVTMGELTSSIAHEINQPLMAIIAAGSATRHWLARQPPDLEEAREAVARIIQDTKRASAVIERIRALLKKGSPQVRPVDVNEVIQEVLALVAGELKKEQLCVKTELAPDVSCVLADRVQFQQVMMNLILNAIDAMSAITDRPRALLIKSENHKQGALIQVQDTGKGLSPELLHRIFEPFFTTKPGGIGMGLSISRSIIEAHGGRLWASPGSPDGAVFQFTLPTRGGNS